MRNRPAYNTIRFWVPIVIMAAALLGMLLNNVARADTFTIHLNSTHISKKYQDYDFNESNYGLGYGWDLPGNYRFVAGGYYNSGYKDTFYGGVEWFKRTDNQLVTEFGFDVAAVSGYNTPIGVAAYARIIDTFRVSITPLVVDTTLEGYVLALGLTFGK